MDDLRKPCHMEVGFMFLTGGRSLVDLVTIERFVTFRKVDLMTQTQSTQHTSLLQQDCICHCMLNPHPHTGNVHDIWPSRTFILALLRQAVVSSSA